MYICSVKCQPRHPVSCQRAQGRCGRHEGGRQADRPGHRPDTADEPEQMGSPLADLRDAVLCRGPWASGARCATAPRAGWAAVSASTMSPRQTRGSPGDGRPCTGRSGWPYACRRSGVPPMPRTGRSGTATWQPNAREMSGSTRAGTAGSAEPAFPDWDIGTRRPPQ